MTEYNEEELDKLTNLDNALSELVGVKIPFNLIKNCFQPIQKWLNEELRGDVENYG